MSGIRFTAVFYLILRGYKTPIFSTIIYYIILNEIFLGYVIKSLELMFGILHFLFFKSS